MTWHFVILLLLVLVALKLLYDLKLIMVQSCKNQVKLAQQAAILNEKLAVPLVAQAELLTKIEQRTPADH